MYRLETPYSGLLGEPFPERGKQEVYQRVGISRAEVEKRVGKTVTAFQNILNRPNKKR